MILATLATFYCLSGLMADGTRIDWSHGNPRVLAASASDLNVGRVHLGDEVCVQFSPLDRVTYTVRDRCSGCARGQVDIAVRSKSHALDLGRVSVIVTVGACQ